MYTYTNTLVAEQGHKGSIDDVVLRNKERKALGADTKTLQEVYSQLKDQTIVVTLKTGTIRMPKLLFCNSWKIVPKVNTSSLQYEFFD